MDVFETIRTDPAFDDLVRRLAGRGAVAAEGLWGSAAPILAGLVAERLGRPLLLVTAHADDADDARDDIETALGTAPDLLPTLEALPGESVADDELAAERLRLCVSLLTRAETRPGGNVGKESDAGPIRTFPPSQLPSQIVAPILALMQPVPAAEAIAARSFDLQAGQALDPDELARWLDGHGFRREDAVEVPGDYARRGGILDVFSHGQTDPVRIEFFGDEVSSIRLFDASTQRSSHRLERVQLPALSFAAEAGAATTSFLALLPPQTLIALREPSEIQELGRSFLQRLGERPGVITPEGLLRRAGDFTQLHLHRFTGLLPDAVRFEATSLPQFDPRPGEALRALGELSREHEVLVLCDNRAEEQRLGELARGEGSRDSGTEGFRKEELGPTARGEGSRDSGTEGFRKEELGPTPSLPQSLRGEGIGDSGTGGLGREEVEPTLSIPQSLIPLIPSFRTALGVLHQGFIWRRTAFVPHPELFHRYRQRRTLRRVQPARPIDTFFDLNAGDPVVHVLHGIGRFLGLKTLTREGRSDEYLALEFAEHAVVHVPISQIHLVQKYVGSFRGRPKLSRLGGAVWKRTKERVAEAVTDLAADLLAVQARRAAEAGQAYPRDTDWQREFEESFLYEETPDQLRALAEIKQDQQQPRPMDRLLCGDVGYGKTELAIRAAFKVMEFGRQVAVLVPTTVLAEQHFETFRERLADYPFAVEVLSRFRSPRDQRRIVDRVRRGQVDVLIGTHRLLSADVHFADLGLVVIDEEQRFGVDAKERLKRMRATVDVLTLTATPIPRTLHMSMLGIRDISSLATAPVDRRAIVTQVRFWEDRLIREAMLRELQRDGQVYFVHNFVRDIHAVANRLRTLVPEARFVVGHGQMAGPELEEVMVQFLHRQADVLVSTNIIESGLDIPTANTIFIDRAERFGLADLHQLRGRVGRARHRAYAYLLLSPRHPVTETAGRRLKAIEHYSDLGAGFQIAMRDLEIRGAGNILGSEQSGHIEAVGYEMYCQLLEQAVRKLKNEPAVPWRPVNLDLGLSATVPRAYIRSDRQRMEVYKRVTTCRTLADIEVLRDDLRDAFGPLPEAVETVLGLAELRVLAAPWGVRSLVLKSPDVIFAVDDLRTIEPLLSGGPGSPRVPDPHTIHWRLPKRYLEPPTLLAVLRQQLRRLPPPAALPTPAASA